MKPLHSNLEPFLRLPDLLGLKVGFVSEKLEEEPRLPTWLPAKGPLHQLVYMGRRHQAMTAVTRRESAGSDLYFVLEHKPQYSLPLYRHLAATGKPVLLISHGLQSLARRGWVNRIGLSFLRRRVRDQPFYIVQLERGDDVLPESERFPESKSICLPIPVSDQLPPVRPPRDGRPRIGVVGMLRKDKPYARLVERLLTIQREMAHAFDLVVGTPFWQKEAWVDSLPVEKIDTSTHQQYREALRGIDILCADFKEADFFLRPSGVAHDAAEEGCFIICPAFPTFLKQINEPSRIGLAFDATKDLGACVREALTILERESPDFAGWREHRKMNRIAGLIREKLRLPEPTRSSLRTSA